MTKKQTKGATEAQDNTNADEGWTEVVSEGVAAPVPKKTRKPKAEVVVEPQPTPAPEPPKAKRAAKAEVAPEPEPTPPSASKKKTKRAKSTATLQDVFAGYVRDLEERGSSDGTIASYRMELQLAGDDLGLETPIASITPERVLQFMTSDRVMKKRNGRGKSPLSIDKTRRVLRQALQFAATSKLVAEAPLPELTATH